VDGVIRSFDRPIFEACVYVSLRFAGRALFGLPIVLDLQSLFTIHGFAAEWFYVKAAYWLTQLLFENRLPWYKLLIWYGSFRRVDDQVRAYRDEAISRVKDVLIAIYILHVVPRVRVLTWWPAIGNAEVNAVEKRLSLTMHLLALEILDS
jgi:hypothetical protein